MPNYDQVQPTLKPSGVSDSGPFFLFVPYPSALQYAAVNCATTRGTIQISQRGLTESTQVTRPDSPIYNLNNSACAGHVICNFADDKPGGAVVAITITNDTQATDGDQGGDFSVTVALGYASKRYEIVADFGGKVLPGKSCFVLITFQLVNPAMA